MFNWINSIVAMILLVLSPFAVASNLTVIRIGAPGANTDLFTSVMSAHLAKQGWDTTVIGFPDCKGAEDWVVKNPTAPVMFTTWSDDFVLPQVDPSHPRNCPGLYVSEETLVTIIAESNHMICSIVDSSPDGFLAHNNAKVGIWNHPVQMSVARDLLKDLGVNHRLVAFARGADMMQALVSKDIDYVILSSENMARNSNANCFITTAPTNVAAKQPTIKDPSVTLVSTESLAPSLTRIDTGLWPVYIAHNVADMKKLRGDVSTILQTATEYAQLWSPVYRLGGVAGGDSVEKQWTKFNSFIESFK